MIMPQETIFVDPNLHYDYDSVYGSCASNISAVWSSCDNNIYENGRRYHAYSEGKYWCPNDEKQNQQLEIFHHVYTLVLHGELYKAPIGDNPERILDIGTGTGIWAIDMAEKFPNARILGNDLSPIHPVWAPSNVEFEVDDCTKEWTHKPNSFNFVHARALYGSIEDWPQLLRRAYGVIKPGGWFESVETTPEYLSDDDTVSDNSPAREWCQFFCEAGEISGKTFELAGKVKPWMEEQGFVNVVQHEYKVPIGPWAQDKHMKEIGNYNILNITEAMEGFTLAIFTRILKWHPDDICKFLLKVRADYMDKNVHAYYRMIVVYGQKPE